MKEFQYVTAISMLVFQ